MEGSNALFSFGKWKHGIIKETNHMRAEEVKECYQCETQFARRRMSGRTAFKKSEKVRACLLAMEPLASDAKLTVS